MRCAHHAFAVATLATAIIGCADGPTIEEPLSVDAELGAAADPLGGEDDRPSILIEPTQLSGQLDRRDQRILDVRSSKAYVLSHIPGAIWVDVDRWKKQALAENGLHDSAAWGRLVSQYGIDDGTRVVVYSDLLPNMARVWWTLKYLGLRDVMLLDGGWSAWTAAELPTSQSIPPVMLVPFKPKFQPHRLAMLEEVKRAVGNDQMAIIDSRSRDEYTGKIKRGRRGGRIPGSVRVEWKDLLDHEGRFRPRDELRELFLSRGAAPEQMVITYCQSGGRASVDAFALELAGYRHVKNYYRSFQQWGADNNVPIESGP